MKLEIEISGIELSLLRLALDKRTLEQEELLRKFDPQDMCAGMVQKDLQNLENLKTKINNGI